LKNLKVWQFALLSDLATCCRWRQQELESLHSELQHQLQSLMSKPGLDITPSRALQGYKIVARNLTSVSLIFVIGLFP